MLNVIYIYFLQSLHRFSMEQYHFVIYIKKQGKSCHLSEIRFIFALVIKAFFVYCKVVKEKEYSSFLNR